MIKGIFVLLCLLMIHTSFHPQQLLNSSKPWKGNAILGNGKLCVVYSDDPRITVLSGGKGIQHLYYNDYTTDYIKSSDFNLSKNTMPAKPIKDSIGMKNFFTTFTSIVYEDGVIQQSECFVHPEDAVVIKSKTLNGKDFSKIFNLILRKKITTDKITTLKSLKRDGNLIFAIWSNNTCLAIAPYNADSLYLTDSSVVIKWKALENEILITAAHTFEIAQSRLKNLIKHTDLYNEAKEHWERWISKGKLPDLKQNDPDKNKLTDFYKRTLYSVKAATVNGMVPADITGQFLTNNMPQLYPRDALMCARVFLKTGHYDEAKQIISFWCKAGIPMKSKGEFYARYDAHTRAVDAGSGARFDEPEWDANGYVIQLLNDYYTERNEWLAPKEFIYTLADFIAGKIDNSGLLYEGGIVEWTGYLPATNMICAAALRTAANIAKNNKDDQKYRSYNSGFKKISSSLIKTFDESRQTYTALRFTGIKTDDNRSIAAKKGDKLFLWDTTSPFGVLWGYDDHTELKKSVEFYEKNTIALNGGLQYFEAKDNAWLSAYGSDGFFFPTAALAEYLTLHGDPYLAKKHIDWMINNSNIYGLMPERIYLNGSDCSPASPLSWCNGEFALSVLTWVNR